jgi:hypothetical protein
MISRFIHTALLLAFFIGANAQKDSASANYRARRVLVSGSALVLTGSSLAYLGNEWYQPYRTGKFHYFNDNEQWLQMDKAGHIYSAYQCGRLMMEAFDWAGYNKKYTLASGAFGFMYLTAIEVLDGFSAGWGFSWGDETANLSGALLAVSQYAAWNEQRILLKFSYSPSGLARYNPSLLGEDQYAQLIKDYNGQTYWLSFGASLFQCKKTAFPKWLNLAIGYGAYGMTGGRSNINPEKDDQGNIRTFVRQRSAYLSVDIDLSKIKTRSRVLKTVFSVVNVLKIPAPALELNNQGIRFHPLFY